MKEQHWKGQKNKEDRLGAENPSDKDKPAASLFKVWETIMQFHPYKHELLNVINILNGIGANCIIIAAALDLQRWKSFCGVFEWTEKDVKVLLEGFKL